MINGTFTTLCASNGACFSHLPLCPSSEPPMSQQAFPDTFRSFEHRPKQLQIHINVQSAATQTPRIATCCRYGSIYVYIIWHYIEASAVLIKRFPKKRKWMPRGGIECECVRLNPFHPFFPPQNFNHSFSLSSMLPIPANSWPSI